MKQRVFNQVRKPLELSRGPGIDTEICTTQAGGNRFNLHAGVPFFSAICIK